MPDYRPYAVRNPKALLLFLLVIPAVFLGSWAGKAYGTERMLNILTVLALMVPVVAVVAVAVGLLIISRRRS